MRSVTGTWLAFAAMAALSTMSVVAVAGCGKVGELRARKSFKSANQAYVQQDYKKAASLYEDSVKADPDLESGSAFFYLANSYDNQFKPSKKGEADNDAFLTKAAENYQTAAEKLVKSNDPREKQLARRSLEFLVAIYGQDKLNDPAKAEPIVQRMITLDPSDTASYFALAKIYEDAGAYDAAEEILLKAKEVKPNDPDVYMQMAGYYNRQGRFDKTIDALQQRAAKEPNNPVAFHTIATYYWDEAYRDFRLKEAQKKEFIQKGLEAVDRAIQLKPDYMEALVYKGLLLRSQALLEKDPKKQQELIKEATVLHDKAEELRKKRAAGVGD
jgi:tetratricopeptide (TPR) repeat protein